MNLSPEKLENSWTQWEALTPLYEKYPAESKAQTSLRFCISHPACTTAIPGAKTPEQVNDNVRAAELGPLPPEMIPAGAY